MEIDAYFDNERKVCLGPYRIRGSGKTGVLSGERGTRAGLSIVGKAMAGARVAVAGGAETVLRIGR